MLLRLRTAALWWWYQDAPLQAWAITFNLLPGRPRPTIQAMFDTITAELATAADKLAHLRRFL